METKKVFKIDEFIETVLISNIGGIVEDNHHYLSFALISHGIELLGTIVEEDENLDFDTEGESRIRFKRGLQLMNDSRYDEHCAKFKRDANDYDLYKHLRCGFAHQLRPTGRIALTHEEEMMREGTTHLELNNEGKLILDVDTLYNDFKKSCEVVITKIRNKEISHDKAYRNFLSVDINETST